MTERKVVADRYKVCHECPAAGHLSRSEHRRKCYGRVSGQIGALACGKKQAPGSARELFPEVFEQGDD